MAGVTPPCKNENANGARLNILLIDNGTHALRDVFDSIIPPSSLHSTLHSATVHSTLKYLRARRILNNQQWNKLYPASKSTPVTSKSFDITLLFVLLRNICGLTCPPTGWDKLPVATDLSREADLARVKYYRNEIYGHITTTAVSDSDFQKYWDEISDILVRLQPHYKPEIERLKVQPIDPEDEKFFFQALTEWEKSDKLLLEKMDEVLELKKRKPVADASQAEECSIKLKSSIKKQLDCLLQEELEEKEIKTEDIFTNLTILRGQKHFRDQENSGTENSNVRPTENICTLKKLSEIFICPENVDKETPGFISTSPKSILLTGKAGIGKSFFCQKLVHDWAHGNLFNKENTKEPDFQFVLLLTFSQLNLLEQDKLDLRGILNRSTLLDEHSIISEELLQYILENPEKLLIVLDGYDEYKYREEIAGDFETRYPNDPCEKMPVPALIAKIMKGKMLKESVVIVSSRPGEEVNLKKVKFDEKLEILGFSFFQVVEYVEKYFKKCNESMKKKVLDHIETNKILLSLSHIPVICFLMCYYMEWQMTESKTTEKLPVTRTELYHEVIKVFIKKHSASKYKEMPETELQEMLHKLSELAVNLLKENKIIFDENDMKRFKLNDEEITNLKASGLLDCRRGVRKSPFDKPPLECTFTHLSLQEYLCAFWYVENNQLPDETSTALTCIFLAGHLSRKKEEKLMKKLMEVVTPRNPDDDRKKLLTLECLHEYRDMDFSKTAIKGICDKFVSSRGLMNLRFVSEMESISISYLLEILRLVNDEQPKNPRPTFPVFTLNITFSQFTQTGIGMICDVLSGSSLKVLQLTCCHFEDESALKGIADLLLKSELICLDLSYSRITDAGVRSIFTALTNRACSVQVLVLRGCRVTDHSLRIITDSLLKTKLRQLDLEENDITDEGALKICTVLIDKECSVNQLYIEKNKNVTDECRKQLKRLIQEHRPIVQLTGFNI